MPKSINIKGTGVAGLWSAIMLCNKGYDVSIYEKQPEGLFSSCSYKAGGMLAPYCEAENADDIITTLGVRSIELWKQFFPENITQKGSLLLSHPKDYNQLSSFKSKTVNYQEVNGNEISDLEPHLDRRFDKGLYYSNEAHLEPRKLLIKMIEYLKSKDVKLYFESYAPNDGNIIIDATGLWAKDNIPIRGVKGEMIVIYCPEVTLNRPVRLLHLRHPIYIVPRDNNQFMIGATTIETQKNSPNISVRSAGELLTQAYHLTPCFAEAEIVEMNAGLRPAFVDNNPNIIKENNIFYLNGLYRHGWTIAPAMAEKLCKII